MKIFTKRLELTNFKAEYAEEFTRVLSDPKIFLFLPESVPTINDIENLIQWFIERDLKNAKNGFKGTNLAILHKENKEIIGWCGLQPFEPIPDKKEIFFGLSSSYWNKGYMSEAAEAVLNYGFKTLDLEEIVKGPKKDYGLESYIRVAAYYLSQEHLSYDKLCWMLAEKQLIIEKSQLDLDEDEIRKNAEEIYKSSVTYDELCWIIAEFDILIDRKYI